MKTVFADLPLRAAAPTITKDTVISRPTGCKACNNTGYKGRIGLFEMFPVDEKAEEVIVSNPTQSQLKELAHKNGMITIKQDGFLKVLSGMTTIDEVEAVAG